MERITAEVEENLRWLQQTHNFEDVLSFHDDSSEKYSSDRKYPESKYRRGNNRAQIDEEVKDNRVEDSFDSDRDAPELSDSDSNDDEFDDEVQLGNTEAFIPSEQIELANEIKTRFMTLNRQLTEYRTNFQKLALNFKEADTKRAELTVQVSLLEEENAELHQALQLSQSKQSSLSIYPNLKHIPLSHNNKINPINNNTDNNNHMIKGEDIRRALLDAGGEEDAIGKSSEYFAIDGQDYFQILYHWISLIMPFKGAINQIQAKFGSSVASYFVFYRWM